MSEACNKVTILSVVFVFLIAGGLLYVTTEHDRMLESQIRVLEADWLAREIEIEAEIHELEDEVKVLRDLANSPYRGRTLTLENQLVLQDYTPNPKHAIVTMMGFPSDWHPYWMGAIGTIRSLRESQTRIPNIVVMHRPGGSIPQFAREAFDQMDVQLIDIDGFDLDELGVDIPGTWGGAFDKLHVWTLTQFEKVLFLDADTLIVQNIDHLFNEDELTAPITPRGCRCYTDFINYPEFFSVSSGFFICKPSLDTFQEMVTLASGPSPDPDDLEQFGGTWHWGDQEMIHVLFDQLNDSWHRLDWRYDVPAGTCSCEEKRHAPVYSYHFVCSFPVPKPWYDPLKPMYSMEQRQESCLIEVFNLWFRMFAKATNFHEIDEVADRDEQGNFIPKDPAAGDAGVVWT